MICGNLKQQTVSVATSYFFLLALFNVVINVTEADDPNPVYIDKNCTITRNFTSNSPYLFSLNTLLLSLSSHVNDDGPYKPFYNTTYSVETTTDTIYALFFCRGDIPSTLCHDCVADASTRIVSECPNNKEAIIWYEECLVRYSDRYFFSILSEWPRSDVSPFNYESDTEMKVIEKTLNDVVTKSVSVTPRFATKEVKLNSEKTIYSLAECTPDLSTQQCQKCLRDIIQIFHQRNKVAEVAEFFFPSCTLMYATYQFYYKDNALPQTSVFSSSSSTTDFYYFNQSCSTTEDFTVNSTYDLNLKKLVSSLIQSSNDTTNTGFNSTKVVGRNPSDSVYGLFMCRGDLSTKLCYQCVNYAYQQLSIQCGLSKEAIIWYDKCLLRYSNHSFFSSMDTSPKYIQEGAEITQNQLVSFNRKLAAKLAEVVAEASKPAHAITGAKKFAIQEADNDYELQKLYILAQCTPDLSNQDCNKCLSKIVEDLKLCCLGKQEGLVMYPSCNLRFESYRFYNKASAIVEAPTPPPTPLVTDLPKTVYAGKAKVPSRTIIISLVVVILVVSLLLFCYAYYLLRSKKRKNKAILKENFGSESATLETLQFSLATIEAATNKFSHENKIGKGGFGEVYKGILSDGRKIAVKRLSKSSGQGAMEFKNEILLIAKLQHRNLVALLGFCLEEEEKMLVYEFVPQKSLDYFLFGSKRERELSWPERYKIIEGIARGILYLHELSRLKVIHRDLKPSNILLDDKMNPKISDFGMAKIVAITDTEGSTNRIVGTYGYMAPEYAMLGQFSEKSDIFSFGVMVLEIISGKKNINCRGSQYADGLLGYVWKQWREENWSQILDSNMIELESLSEVIKCIHIGLLCVQENPNARPSMVAVLQYLSNDLIQLPFPQEPVFFLYDQMEPTIAEMNSRLGQHANNSTPCSINEMSLSILFPR